jgi:hypothetical protein
MAAKAVNRRMPSTERSYTSYYPRMTFFQRTGPAKPCVGVSLSLFRN